MGPLIRCQVHNIIKPDGCYFFKKKRLFHVYRRFFSPSWSLDTGQRVKCLEVSPPVLGVPPRVSHMTQTTSPVHASVRGRGGPRLPLSLRSDPSAQPCRTSPHLCPGLPHSPSLGALRCGGFMLSSPRPPRSPCRTATRRNTSIRSW